MIIPVEFIYLILESNLNFFNFRNNSGYGSAEESTYKKNEKKLSVDQMTVFFHIKITFYETL